MHAMIVTTIATRDAPLRRSVAENLQNEVVFAARYNHTQSQFNNKKCVLRFVDVDERHRSQSMPPSPYRIEDNPYTLLDKSDLVLIDAIGTGFSRAADNEMFKKFWGVKGDIEAFSEFIRLFISRNERWASPLFILGESYGTTRAAGIAGYLADRGISFNGITLLSTVLNFQTLEDNFTNDQPYTFLIPSFTMSTPRRDWPKSRGTPMTRMLRPVEALAGLVIESFGLKVVNSTGTAGTASWEMEWSRAHAQARRSTPQRVQCPCRIRHGARCRTCADRDTT